MTTQRAERREVEVEAGEVVGPLPADTGAASEPCAELPLESRIEALLLAAERPSTTPRLAAVLGLPAKGAAPRVEAAIEALNRHYEQSGRSFRAERLAGGWQLMTLGVFHPLLSRLHAQRVETTLSQAALETLAIIAYRQPVMRAEIEAIRGVACGEVLRGLLERRLARITGRSEELGRPMLYGTSREFLKVFGLASLDDLPPLEGESRARRGGGVAAAAADEAPATTETAQAEAASGTDDGDEDAGH